MNHSLQFYTLIYFLIFLCSFYIYFIGVSIRRISGVSRQRRVLYISALLLVSNDLFRILDSGAEVCAVFFDFKKAFDSFPHRNLISVLKCSGINPALLHIICSYLTGRTQSVVVDGACSNSVPVVSGVPQGSVLGPPLLLLYINNYYFRCSPLTWFKNYLVC